MELEFHVCTINKSTHTKKSGNLFIDPRTSQIFQPEKNLYKTSDRLIWSV